MVDFEIGASESRIIAAIVARARRLIERFIGRRRSA